MTPPLTLTARETDVVRLLLSGQTYEQIAGTLGITRRTVRAHVRTIAQRLEGSDPPVRRVLRFAHHLMEPSAA